MLSPKIVCFLAYTVMFALSVHAVDHGLIRGGDDASHRSLQGFRPRAWVQSEAVCRKSGSGENRTYTTRKIVNALWRLYEVMGMTNGVKGACEEICPCGEMGVCTSLPGDKAAGSNEVASTFQCSCVDGTTSSGSSCTSTIGNAPESCGGFAGTACSDKSMECIDDPSDTCDPENGGADCLGICVATCGGFTAGPQPGCPDGSICTNNPNTPDCLLAADCTGVCSPLPSCKLSDGTGCPEGYSCTNDDSVDCNNNIDCPGKCTQACAGFTAYPQAPCSSGTFCVNNPATPDCLIAADCTGVCLPPPKCSTKTGEGCWEGFSCTLDPNTACIALEGFDCPGICAPTCAGGRANNVDCPNGTYCVDNPATPGCVIAADCTGVCLPPAECDIKSSEGCSEGFVCTISDTLECANSEGSACPGVCAPSCAGGISPNVECPDGTECIDNPATPNCLIAADCVGVCAAPSA